jgi:hypothetical protein
LLARIDATLTLLDSNNGPARFIRQPRRGPRVLVTRVVEPEGAASKPELDSLSGSAIVIKSINKSIDCKKQQIIMEEAKMRKATRRLSVAALALAMSTAFGLAWADANKPTIGVVVKIGGIPWFNAMEAGIKKAAGETGADAWMVGPTQADAAQQVKAVEDLIARKVDVIAVVPNDAKPRKWASKENTSSMSGR